MTTDAGGAFFVKGKKGTSFSIEKMTKEGYLSPGHGTQYSFVYSNLSSGKQSIKYHSANSSQPVVYRMWKRGETEPLIKTFAKLVIDPEKGVNEVYYSFGLNRKPSPQAMPGWDLKVTGKNQPSPNKRRPQDDYWEVTLTTNEGGGVLLTDDLHNNLAPESGFKNSLTLKSTDQDNPWDRLVRRAYFRSAAGKKYAAFRLDLSFGTRKTGEWFEVRLVDLRINPNGSRNLEYDPSKQIIK